MPKYFALWFLYELLIVIIIIFYVFQLYETPFFVCMDHDKRAVVVTIRGTLSLQVQKETLQYTYKTFVCALTYTCIYLEQQKKNFFCRFHVMLKVKETLNNAQ